MGRMSTGQSAAGARSYREAQDGALLGHVGVGVWCDSDAGAANGDSDGRAHRRRSDRRHSDAFGLNAGTPSTPMASSHASHVFPFDFPVEVVNRVSTGSSATACGRPRAPSLLRAFSSRPAGRAKGAAGLGLSILRATSAGAGAVSAGHSPTRESRDTFSLPPRDCVNSCGNEDVADIGSYKRIDKVSVNMNFYISREPLEFANQEVVRMKAPMNAMIDA